MGFASDDGSECLGKRGQALGFTNARFVNVGFRSKGSCNVGFENSGLAEE